MQQFTVPQFIDVEDKIIGPITTRQFIILLGVAMVIAICYKIFDFTAFLTISIFLIIVAVIFAFFKINGRPFHLFILNVIQTLKRPAVRVWNNATKIFPIEEEAASIKIEKEIIPQRKQYTSSRLAELALIVDTKGGYKGGNGADKDVKLLD